MRIVRNNLLRRCSERAFTLVEMVFAASLGTLVMGGLLVLIVEVNKEQRRGMTDCTLEIQAGLAQDKLTRIIHSMSAGESVILSDPIATGSTFFRRVILAEGQAPTYPREELIYSTNAFTLTHDQNRSTTGDEVTLVRSNAMYLLRNCYFYISMKVDGSPDNSAVNVYLEFDDNYFAGRKNTSRQPIKTKVTRTFTVKMRNN